jgi:hypothetical protein
MDHYLFGIKVADYSWAHQEFGGIVVPTLRRSLPLEADGTVVAKPSLIDVEIFDAAFEQCARSISKHVSIRLCHPPGSGVTATCLKTSIIKNTLSRVKDKVRACPNHSCEAKSNKKLENSSVA